jgi:DNA-binding NtrC family response regulator
MRTLNCAAVPEGLLESELFGHRRGAFTGADRDRIGLLVSAQGGTVLLDEIGEMSKAMQAKLLRALQEDEVRPLGSTQTVATNFRLVTATHRDLRALVDAGTFREDLYYRIAVVEVPVPALRDRLEDLPLLTDALLQRLAPGGARRLTAGALQALARHPWPGNVRELENVLARALLMRPSGPVEAGDLDLGARPRKIGAEDRATFEATEAALIRATLNATAWNISETSRRLGIPRNTLYRKLDRYGLR